MGLSNKKAPKGAFFIGFDLALLAQAVWTRPARSYRNVHAVREDGEHCPGSKWQAK